MPGKFAKKIFMYRFLLVVHILAGTIALVGGLLAIIARKGKKQHLLSGTWFYMAMYLVGASAVIMSLTKWNPFLLSIGLFSTYLTYSGKQAITYWRLKAQHVPRMKEKLPVLLAFLTSLVMIGAPLYEMIHKQIIFIPLSAIFGSIMLAGTIRDFIVFGKPDSFRPHNKDWLLKHIGMMGGAYISAITAFLVVNVSGVPSWIPWLMPTVAGSALISVAIRSWKIRLEKKPVRV